MDLIFAFFFCLFWLVLGQFIIVLMLVARVLAVSTPRFIFFILFYRSRFSRQGENAKMVKVQLITTFISVFIYIVGIILTIIFLIVRIAKASSENKGTGVWNLFANVWVDAIILLTILLIDLYFWSVFKHYQQFGNIGDYGVVVDQE